MQQVVEAAEEVMVYGRGTPRGYPMRGSLYNSSTPRGYPVRDSLNNSAAPRGYPVRDCHQSNAHDVYPVNTKGDTHHDYKQRKR